MSENLYARVMLAEKRIRPFIRETPLEYSYILSKMAGCNVYLKLENVQVTGSFKARGALNKVISIGEKQPSASIVAASTGNHGLGVSYALSETGLPGKIFLPKNAHLSKLEALRLRNAPVELYGDTWEETEHYARQLAESTGQPYVSPCNDIDVIAGQGTIAVELIRQLPSVDCVFVSIGGGGLVSGISSFLKPLNPNIKIIGCLPENAPTMYECIRAGKIINVKEKPTLSDATAGGVESGSITFPLCQKYVDNYELVSEEMIIEAMKLVLNYHRQIIEGSAGVAVAAIIKNKEQLKGKNVAAVICGGNTDMSIIKRIVCDDNNEDL